MNTCFIEYGAWSLVANALMGLGVGYLIVIVILTPILDYKDKNK